MKRRQRYISSARICPKQTLVGFAAFIDVVNVFGESLMVSSENTNECSVGALFCYLPF